MPQATKDFLTDAEMESLSKSPVVAKPTSSPKDFLTDDEMNALSPFKTVPTTLPTPARPAYDQNNIDLSPAGLAATNAREMILGAVEGLGIDPSHPLSSAAKQAWSMLQEGLGGKVYDPSAPLTPIDAVTAGPKEMYEGYKEGDSTKMAHGAGSTLSVTTPAVYGAAEAAKAGVAGVKGSKTYQYSQDRPLVKFTPDGHLRNALKPDLDAAGLKLAGEQLKAGEAKIGKPVKDVDTAKAAARAQFQQELMPQRRSIIDPQKDVVVPDSRRQLVKAKIAAIPADIRPGTPEYLRIVQKIQDSLPKDLTIGDLESMNSSLNAQTRAYHQAKLSQALGKEETVNGALDIAAEGETRNLMQHGMERYGLGGADALKEVNKRIGTLIKLEDAIDTASNTARVEAAVPRFRRINISKEAPFIHTGSTTINEGIAKAMRSWESQSPAIAMSSMRTPATSARMLPAHTSIDVGPVPDSGGTADFSGFVRKPKLQIQAPATDVVATVRGTTPRPSTTKVNPDQIAERGVGPRKLLNGPATDITATVRNTTPRPMTSKINPDLLPETSGPDNNRGIRMGSNPTEATKALPPKPDDSVTFRVETPEGPQHVIITPVPEDANRLVVTNAAKKQARDPKTGKFFTYYTEESTGPKPPPIRRSKKS